MSLLLVRHGETALNAARVLQPADTPLSDIGRSQALAVARRLCSSGAVALISSDLPRALQTAEAIQRATGLPLQTSALLHERNFGDLRGRPYDSLGFDPMQMSEAPPGGESPAEFAERCLAAMQMLVALRQALPGPLIVITHGLVIRQWLPEPRPTLANTSLTILSHEAPYGVELLNCTTHLANDSPRPAVAPV